MYVTRPLSLYYNSPKAATEPPPEGPNSGILVVEDEEAEKQARLCCGLFQTSRLSGLPFPQNKMIEVRYTFRLGCLQQTYSDDVFFVPVIDQPLSSNRYYVVRANRKDRGKTCTCSKEEDASTSCFCTSADDVDPIPFDHKNIYQQVKIICHRDKYYAKSVASDGIPPQFLRRKNWRANASEPLNFSLGEALGMNTTLRAKMPNLNSSMVVGKWYCPYIFVKEGTQLIREQMRKSMFYEMSLEQCWEKIYACENYVGEGNTVEVDVRVAREVALLNGNEILDGDFKIDDRLIWFKTNNLSENGLGLSLIIWERMRWEEERGGFVSGEKTDRVLDTYEGESGWKKFGCYMLIERFVLRRNNGSVALTYEFKHTNKIIINWE